ncbi:MAG: DNA polymerase III subunit delta' [Rhizobiaceae bacterium]
MDLPESHDSLPGYPAPAQALHIFGHDTHEAFLCSAYGSGKLHHALIFNGLPGIGKASFAFRFARHIIANADWQHAPTQFELNENPVVVRQAAGGAHPQLLHLTRPVDAKSGKFKTQLTIDETRRIGRFLSHTVAGNGFRVVIIDPVNDMNANAANALLKNLEEPTPRTLFILIAHTTGRLLPTIRSRCLQLQFNALNEDAMVQALDTLGVRQKLKSDEFTRLIALSEGSPRVAAMLADGGGLDILKAIETLLATAVFNPSAALRIGEALAARDSEPLLMLTIDLLFGRAATQARELAREDPSRAQLLAILHHDLGTQIEQALRFNLDRRQMVFDLLSRLHGTSRAAAAG